MAEAPRKLDNSSALPVTAPEIVEFWRENLRAQFNARLGIQDETERSRFPTTFLLCTDRSHRSGASEKTASDQSFIPRRGAGGFPPGR